MDISEESLRALVKQEALEEGLTLIDMKLARHRNSVMLRVFADRQGGITVGECARFSRQLALLLENQQVFPGKYILEVSSPGLDRPLKTREEFELKVGENIKFFYSDGSDNPAQLSGKLIGIDDDRVRIAVSDGEVNIEFDKISKGQIIF